MRVSISVTFEFTCHICGVRFARHAEGARLITSAIDYEVLSENLMKTSDLNRSMAEAHSLLLGECTVVRGTEVCVECNARLDTAITREMDEIKNRGKS